MDPPSERPRASFWQRWYRSALQVIDVAGSLLILYFLGWLVSLVVDQAGRWPVGPQICFGIVFGLFLALVAPPIIAALLPGPKQGAARQSAEVQPLIDQLALKSGLRWKQHWMSEVEALVQSGKPRAAAKMYSEKLGVPLLEGERIVCNWQTSEPERTLRALLQHLHPSQPTPPSGA